MWFAKIACVGFISCFGPQACIDDIWSTGNTREQCEKSARDLAGQAA